MDTGHRQSVGVDIQTQIISRLYLCRFVILLWTWKVARIRLLHRLCRGCSGAASRLGSTLVKYLGAFGQRCCLLRIFRNPYRHLMGAPDLPLVVLGDF